MADAFEWYEKKREELGADFLNEIEEYLQTIARNPEQYKLQKHLRIAIMRRFPYKIVYEIERESIIVYAIYHDKRDPEKISEP